MNAEDTNSTGRPLREGGGFNPELTPTQFEAEFWGQVLERQPYYEDVLRRQAENLARAARYADLLPIDRRMVELRPRDPIVHYNLTCTLTRLDRIPEALAMLQRAIELGYCDFDHIETDPDLDSLRELPDFQAILKPHRA